jgi:hypothetical protein
VGPFVASVQQLGFKLERREDKNIMFVLLYFRKTAESPPVAPAPAAAVTKAADRDGPRHPGGDRRDDTRPFKKAKWDSAGHRGTGDRGSGDFKRKFKGDRDNRNNNFKGNESRGEVSVAASLPVLKACRYKKR